MKIVIITHPTYTGFFSIKLYTEMLKEKCKQKGYEVEIWQAENYYDKQPVSKINNYYYQFILFPKEIKKRLQENESQDCLYVFVDQALGYLVPYFKQLPHVIHCHDFLAQKSALNEIPENKVKVTGKIYQALIRKGFKKGKNFISISRATQRDLHRFLGRVPAISEVVYNGLNQDFDPNLKNENVFKELKKQFLNTGTPVYLLHVGGEHFYKNREGALRLFLELKKNYGYQGDFLMIGPSTAVLKNLIESSRYKDSIHIVQGISAEMLKRIYSNAEALLFPSLEEGFGWPIAEAMASGCPVITTNKAPMTEVGGDAAIYIERLDSLDFNSDEAQKWLKTSAEKINQYLVDGNTKKILQELGLENSKRFESNSNFEKINDVYQKVLKQFRIKD